MEILTQSQLNRSYLSRQRLLEPSAETVYELIQSLGGLQAQEGPAPYFALHARLAEFQKSDLDRLRLENKLLRATLHRRTIHLMAAEDFLAWNPHYQPRVIGDLPKRGFPVANMNEWLPRIREELAGRPFGKQDVIQAMKTIEPPVDSDQASHFTLLAGLELVRVPGPAGESLGGKERWITVETLAGQPVKSQPMEQMVLRYLNSFGPATPGDFTAWSGLPAARPVFDGLADKLSVYQNEQGKRLYDVEGLPILSGDEQAPPVQLLSDFDNLILGHADRTRIISDEHRKRMNKNLLSMCPMLVDGWFAGTWKARNKAGVAEAILTPYISLTSKQRKLFEEKAVEALAMWRPEFSPTITWA